jgi:hypothetical protein
MPEPTRLTHNGPRDAFAERGLWNENFGRRLAERIYERGTLYFAGERNFSRLCQIHWATRDTS